MTDQTQDNAYDGPPDYRVVGRHDLFPATDHDQTERYNFLAHLTRHMASNIMPGVGEAYSARVEPNFKKTEGRAPEHRNEARKALLKDPMFQTWSAMRRNSMEMRQQAGLSVVLGQLDSLIDKTQELVDTQRLQLDPNLSLPEYVTGIDHHCMPGSYHTERVASDVSGAANYDSGLFVTTGGMLGRYADGGGRGVVDYIKRNMPDFAPKKILDIGCGLGHNVLPIAEAFPDAHVVAVDVGAPMLRYGAARAVSLGIHNVTFVQGNVEDLGDYLDGSFDWIQSTMFLHETSYRSLRKIMAETRRLIAPGGLVLHVEQPQYDDDMPVFEQAMRDWDAFYNNEPFWTKLHEIDLDQYMIDAGFAKEDLIHGGVTAVVDTTLFPDAADDDVEDYGRKAAWHITGAIVGGTANAGEAA